MNSILDAACLPQAGMLDAGYWIKWRNSEIAKLDFIDPRSSIFYPPFSILHPLN
jgi:hypothetical protein